jgi:copper amine oxidase-like protein
MYRGKMVLKRAHVPILNVKYDADACGPYRDWQYSEGYFQTDAVGFNDIGPGFRITKSPATTALESGNDTGNFKGVAVYTQGTELVLVTELNAGWYRYIHEWRLDSDGTIRPRYGFGATNSSCVCAIHHHHVYWRFDFDIKTPDKNAVFPVVEGAWWQPPAIATEGQFFRNQGTNAWLVKNLASGDGYKIVPGNDGTAYNDPFAYGKGDVWVLQYHSSGTNPAELDDPNTSTAANIDSWVNGESVINQDIVVWYGAHFDHTDGGNGVLDVVDTHNVDILSGGHVIGPDLIPVSW